MVILYKLRGAAMQWVLQLKSATVQGGAVMTEFRTTKEIGVMHVRRVLGCMHQEDCKTAPDASRAHTHCRFVLYQTCLYE